MSFQSKCTLFIALAAVILTTTFSTAVPKADGAINHKIKSERPTALDDIKSMSTSAVNFPVDGLQTKMSAEEGDYVFVPIEISTTEPLNKRLWNKAIQQAIRKWMREEGIKSKKRPLLNLDLTRKTIFSTAELTKVNGVRTWSFQIRLQIIRNLPKVSNKKNLKENSENIRNLTDIILKNDFYIEGEGEISTEIKTEFSIIRYNRKRLKLLASEDILVTLEKQENGDLDLSRFVSTCASQRCATKVDVWSTQNIKSVIVQKAVQKVKAQAGFKLVFNYDKTFYWKVQWNIWKVVFPFEESYQSNQD